MIEPGDTVVIGLSGGADSVCLLLLLQELFCCQHAGRDGSGQEERQVPGEEPEMRLYAVHVNHQLRREEADAVYEKLNSIVKKFLSGSLEYLGMIPQDSLLEKSVRAQKVVSENYPNAKSVHAYREVARELLGEGDSTPQYRLGITQLFNQFIRR